ncbi:hypothetical protein [Methanorbis furvi]|uniref:Tetrahydromethanopterin S-methyltransferase n=1 Tax=Methanorbis furvi TaxID=3028299 RepID=A0AAE4MED1_9EURY|nr:hypothetical protein [Methanocorpusculaceae archaeon Ag1]
MIDKITPITEGMEPRIITDPDALIISSLSDEWIRFKARSLIRTAFAIGFAAGLIVATVIISYVLVVVG